MFKGETVSPESMINFSEKYFFRNQNSLNKHITSYKEFKNDLENSRSNYGKINEVLHHTLEIIKAYTIYLGFISTVNPDSGDFDINMRLFEQVLKELYEFAIIHKNIIEVTDIFILLSTKSKLKISKTSFNYTKNGLYFLNYENLNKLMKKCNLWNKHVHEIIRFSFVFNADNLVKALKLSKSIGSFSIDEFQSLLYKSFLGKSKIQKNKYLSYPDLLETIYKRLDAYNEGKVSRTYLNKMCFMYEESTDENGDKLKCNICLGDLENNTEVCRLLCGHINCKNCIEDWFDIKNYGTNSDQQTLIDEISNKSQEEIEDENGSEYESCSEDDSYSEYEIDSEDEVEVKKNRCPTCRHICS